MKRLLTVLLLFSGAFSILKAEDITLENDRVKLVFDNGGKDFIFKSFSVDGKELLRKDSGGMDLWSLTIRGTYGELPTIVPRNTYYDGGTLSEDGRSVSFVWRIVIKDKAQWPVTATVTLPQGDCVLPVWNISADLPSGWIVHELEYPRINIARLDGMKGIMPVGYGAEYPLGDAGQIWCRYPSCTGGMQLILAHNENETFLMMARDKNACNKDFKIYTQPYTLTFALHTIASYSWTTQQGHFELPWDTVLGYNADTWENTVLKWYRPFTFECQWGAATLKDRNVVKWIKDTDLWLRPMGVSNEIEDKVKTAYDTFGKGIGLHWYYWHKHRFDSNYPEMYPAQEGFGRMVSKFQNEYGCHVTPYTNGRLWDTSNHTYEDLHGYEASCRQMDGTLYTEIYSSKVINSVTCPASQIWQNIQKENNRIMFRDYDPDGIYIDQIGCALAQPCYAENHGHAKGGGGWWPAAYRKLLTEMREEIYKGTKAVTTEENAEPYIDLFDMMLVVNGPHKPTVHMVPLFPLVYSDRAIYSGFTYLPWKLNDGGFLFTQMKSLLWGSQLGWVDVQSLFDGNNPNEIRFLENLVAFRKKNHDLFVGGRFMQEFAPGGEDNPLMNVPNYQITNVVMGARWISVKGKEAFVLVNMSADDHTVTVPGGKTVTVKAFDAVRL